MKEKHQDKKEREQREPWNVETTPEPPQSSVAAIRKASQPADGQNQDECGKQPASEDNRSLREALAEKDIEEVDGKQEQCDMGDWPGGANPRHLQRILQSIASSRTALRE